MDKEEQIQEMAKILLNNLGWADYRMLDAKRIVTNFWDNGYRKVEKPPVLTGKQIEEIYASATAQEIVEKVYKFVMEGK